MDSIKRSSPKVEELRAKARASMRANEASKLAVTKASELTAAIQEAGKLGVKLIVEVDLANASVGVRVPY